MSALPVPQEVFYSYADADESLCNELEKHLSLLRREGLIITWHKRQIIAGTDWQKAVDRHLSTASIILLLISSDFLASDYCYGTEMQRAIQRHQAHEAYVIPIVLRSVDWKSSPFGNLKALPSNGRPVTTWNNYDDAFADIAQGIRTVLESMEYLAGSTSSPAFPRIWNVPYPKNPLFTGREEILRRLSALLHGEQPAAHSYPQAISGLGGIGKTQIAVEYTYQHCQDYQAILWTGAQTSEALFSGYVALAELLSLPEKDGQDQAIAVQAVIRWLATHSGWLLVLDNADDLTMVRGFLPPVCSGHILLTTRSQVIGRLANRIEVESMPQDVGILFLLRRALLIAPDAQLEHAAAADILTAKAIYKVLGGLPLALDQAGAYIEETQCSLQQYLEHYRTRRTQLLQRRGGVVFDHPEPVAATWSLSFEKIELTNPAAADLLRLCSYLSANAIPEEIVTVGADYLGSSLSLAATDPLLLDDAIATLRSYPLVRRDARNSTLSIHHLVQVVVRNTMTREESQQWAERVVRVMDRVFPQQDGETRLLCERYLPHALSCAEVVMQEHLMLLEAASLLYRLGWYLYRYGQAKDAEPLMKQAAEIYELKLGREHWDTIWSLTHLAFIYQVQKKYREAEQLHQQVIKIYEQIFGPEHYLTVNNLHNLASVYQKQGKYRKAELLLKRALRANIQEAAHRDIATNLSNLALLYQDQGKYELAEPLLIRVLAMREQLLGPDHLTVAWSLNILALLYRVQGKDEQAEPLLVRALAISEQQLEAKDGFIVRLLDNLAELYQTQEKYKLAEPLYKRALAISEELLGLEHPLTITVHDNYASLRYEIHRKREFIQGETPDHDTTRPE